VQLRRGWDAGVDGLHVAATDATVGVETEIALSPTLGGVAPLLPTRIAAGSVAMRRPSIFASAATTTSPLRLKGTSAT
jgi:hypothetical protein